MRTPAAVFVSGFLFLALGFLNRFSGRLFASTGLSPVWIERLAFAFAYIIVGFVAFQLVRQILGVRLAHLPGFFAQTAAIDKPVWKSVLYGLAGGGGAFLLVRGILEIWKRSAGMPEATSPMRSVLDEGGSAFLFLLLASGVVTPILEEIFYRGMLLGFLRDAGVPTSGALVFQALLFALAHTGPAVPVMVFVGLVFGILFWRQGLSSAIVAHVVYNSAILVEAWWTGQ